jgi:hypothetical protein
MAEPAQSNTDKVKTELDKAVSDYVHGLREEHKMLVALKTHLYGGSWEPMIDDLRNRLAGKPYIFKLANRIQDDIERIEEMRRFEAEHRVDLANCVDLSPRDERRPRPGHP